MRPESDRSTDACKQRMRLKMRDANFRYQIENAYEELKNHPDIVSISNGGPITNEERAKGAKSIEPLVNLRYVVIFHL